MNRAAFRAIRFSIAILLLASASCPSSPAQSKRGATAPPDKPVIRAVTAFVNLDRASYQQQIADALGMLRRAQTIFESRGYPVQGLRIATQPFPQYTEGMTADQALAFFKELDNLAVKNNFTLSIGPAMPNAGDPASQADLLAEILRNTKTLNASLVVAADDGVRWKAVGAAASVMKKLEDTERSQGNFRFAAIAMVQPLTPFFPAAYSSGFGHQFAVALQSANTVTEAFKGTPDLAAARQKLIDKLGGYAFEIERHAGRVDSETGWSYMGIDLSPAPLKDVSIAMAMEELTGQPVGSSGTLTAAATITSAIRDIKVKQTGYNGLMIPILEDSLAAKRWSEGRINISALLSYSSVCGTGLDTVPLPGNISLEQIELIIGDMASLAYKWHKPLSARLLPVAGKAAGETTDFDNQYLVNATIQPVTTAAAAGGQQ
jgi:uncharacterized protein (UPF0210 family)